MLLKGDLQSFFFQELCNLNKGLTSPVPQENLFYMALVLERFGQSDALFAQDESGRSKNQLLGAKLLEINQMTHFAEKARALQEVGDLSLMFSGYFPPEKKRSILNKDYYIQLAKSAYQQLNHVRPEFLDVMGFFAHFAASIMTITSLMNLLSSKLSNQNDLFERYLILNGEPKDKIKLN